MPVIYWDICKVSAYVVRRNERDLLYWHLASMKQTDRQIYRQMGRQTDRHTLYIQTDRRADRQTDRQADIRTDIHIQCKQTDKLTYRQRVRGRHARCKVPAYVERSNESILPPAPWQTASCFALCVPVCVRFVRVCHHLMDFASII